MKTLYIILAIILLSTIACVDEIENKTNNPNLKVGNRIETNSLIFDFGNIYKDDSLQKDFVIRNKVNFNLIINKVSIPENFSLSEDIKNREIKAYDSLSLKIKFQPLKDSLTIENDSLKIETNYKIPLNIQLIGSSIPKIKSIDSTKQEIKIDSIKVLHLDVNNTIIDTIKFHSTFKEDIQIIETRCINFIKPDSNSFIIKANTTTKIPVKISPEFAETYNENIEFISDKGTIMFCNVSGAVSANKFIYINHTDKTRNIAISAYDDATDYYINNSKYQLKMGRYSQGTLYDNSLNFIPMKSGDTLLIPNASKILSIGRLYFNNDSELDSNIFKNCINVKIFYKTFGDDEEYEEDVIEPSNITTIPKSLFKNCKRVESFYKTFANASYLNEIPQEIFSYNTEVISFEGIYKKCLKINTIPDNLFINNTKVSNFNQAFMKCINLVDIPVGLFKNKTEAINFNDVFRECHNITIVPDQFFSNCSKATDFNRAFQDCGINSIGENIFHNCTNAKFLNSCFKNTNINSIPDNLFINCVSLLELNSTFKRTGLSSIPENLFENCSQIYDLTSIFESTSITTIPSNLFSNLTNLINLSKAFSDTQLSNVPANLFENCTKLENMNYIFSRSNLNSIPNGLFANCSNIKYFENSFDGTQITSIPADLFQSCTKAINFNYTFSSTQITSIPTNLFSNCTNAESFKSTFQYTSITQIPATLFKECKKAINFTQTFSSTEITSIPSELFKDLGNATTFISTFESCNNLVTIGADLFKNCVDAENFKSCFSDNVVASIPSQLFNDCTKAINFERCFSYTKITSIPALLFKKCANVENFSSTFENCKITNMGIDVFNSNYLSKDGKIFTNQENLNNNKFIKFNDFIGWNIDSDLTIVGFSDIANVPVSIKNNEAIRDRYDYTYGIIDNSTKYKWDSSTPRNYEGADADSKWIVVP
jgi:hypothetical protein